MKTDLIVDLAITAIGIVILLAFPAPRRIFFDLFREDPAFKIPEPWSVSEYAIDKALSDGPLTIEELSARLLASPDAVYRSVLLLVQEGFLHATEIEGDVLISLG